MPVILARLPEQDISTLRKGTGNEKNNKRSNGAIKQKDRKIHALQCNLESSCHGRPEKDRQPRKKVCFCLMMHHIRNVPVTELAISRSIQNRCKESAQQERQCRGRFDCFQVWQLQFWARREHFR